MEYSVQYQGKKAGQIRIQIHDIWVSFQAECSLESLDVFRCYGRVSGNPPLLLGVLEPEIGRGLTLSRSISMTQLHQQHAYPDLPTEYFLLGAADTMPTEQEREEKTPPRAADDADIGDPLIAACLQKGQMERHGQTVFGVFAPGHENPMAFLLAVCHLEKREGVFYAVYELPAQPK